VRRLAARGLFHGRHAVAGRFDKERQPAALRPRYAPRKPSLRGLPRHDFNGPPARFALPMARSGFQMTVGHARARRGFATQTHPSAGARHLAR